jgi:hypothetical protein
MKWKLIGVVAIAAACATTACGESVRLVEPTSFTNGIEVVVSGSRQTAHHVLLPAFIVCEHRALGASHL